MLIATATTKTNLSIADERTCFVAGQLLLAREPEQTSPGARLESSTARIVEIQHRVVGRSLVLEYANFGGSIFLHAAVTIEMIGGDIQHHCDMRMKSLDSLKLKALYLDYVDSFGGRIIDQQDNWSPDVASNQGSLTGTRNEISA